MQERATWIGALGWAAFAVAGCLLAWCAIAGSQEVEAQRRENGLLSHYVAEQTKLVDGQAVRIPAHYHRLAAFCDQCNGRPPRFVQPTPQPLAPPVASPYQPQATSPPADRAGPATVPQPSCECGDWRGELAATNKSVQQLRGDVTQVQQALTRLEQSVAAINGSLMQTTNSNTQRLDELERQPAVCPLPQVVRPSSEDVAEIAGQVAEDEGLLAKIKQHAGKLVAGKVAEATGVEGFLLRHGWAIGGPIGIGLTAIGIGLAIRRRRRSAGEAGAAGSPSGGFLGGLRRGVRRRLGAGDGRQPPAED
jgi:hypothetical protein